MRKEDSHGTTTLVDRVVADVETDEFAEDDRSLTDLMVDQVEFADIIVLNKTSLVSKKTLDTIRGVIAQLNPSAKLIETNYSRVDPTALLNVGVFDFEKAMSHAGLFCFPGKKRGGGNVAVFRLLLCPATSIGHFWLSSMSWA